MKVTCYVILIKHNIPLEIVEKLHLLNLSGMQVIKCYKICETITWIKILEGVKVNKRNKIFPRLKYMFMQVFKVKLLNTAAILKIIAINIV